MGRKNTGHVFHMDLIHAVYPDAQFIHIIRDGRSVVRSLQNMKWAPQEIKWSVDRWKDSIIAARRSADSFPDGQYAEIRYEDITSDTEKSLANLCQFLEEDFAPVMLEFHRPENNSWGVSQDAVARQSVRQSYRALTFRERAVLKKRAGKLLRELGYV